MNAFIFDPASQPALPIVGETDLFPVHRIFCVGRNYVAHATEMGGEVDREAPWYFTKSCHALCQTGQTVPYPPGTSNYHHEIELVVAIGAEAFEVPVDQAEAAVFGYACGLDMTRRDRQQDGKDHRRPWSLGKDLENGAVIAPISRAADVGPLGDRRISLEVNGELRQDAPLTDMVWSVAEVIAHLSRFYHLQPGDLIMTGTPAGVGPIVAGDVLRGSVDGLTPLEHRLG